MTNEAALGRLSDDELIGEIEATEELVYDINCFGVRDLAYLEHLYREADRRRLDRAVRGKAAHVECLHPGLELECSWCGWQGRCGEAPHDDLGAFCPACGRKEKIKVRDEP